METLYTTIGYIIGVGLLIWIALVAIGWWMEDASTVSSQDLLDRQRQDSPSTEESIRKHRARIEEENKQQ